MVGVFAVGAAFQEAYFARAQQFLRDFVIFFQARVDGQLERHADLVQGFGRVQCLLHIGFGNL